MTSAQRSQTPSPLARIADLADAIKKYAVGNFHSVTMCKNMAREIIMQCEIVEKQVKGSNERSK